MMRLSRSFIVLVILVLVLLFALGAAVGVAGNTVAGNVLGVTTCSRVHNVVTAPAGLARDVADLRYDLRRGKMADASWEALVLRCTLVREGYSR